MHSLPWLALALLLHHHGLSGRNVVHLARDTSNYGRLIKLLPLVLHQAEQLVVSEPVVDHLAAWLLRVI